MLRNFGLVLNHATGFFGLIIFFSAASYIVGTKEILKGKYKPNLFSRFVWLLLAINTFAAVAIGDSTASSLVLAFVFLAGNTAIFLLSLGNRKGFMGRLELFCLFLLLVSGVVWFITDSPILNLLIGLIAHFIGGIPAYVRVWKNSESESTRFWSLFFIASVLSVIAGIGEPINKAIFPIYFSLFDGGMTILSIRKKQKE